LFIAADNTVKTFIDKDGNSYADIRIFVTKIPDKTTIQNIEIMTDYSPLPDRSRDEITYKEVKAKRERKINFSLEVVHEDIIEISSSSSGSSASSSSSSSSEEKIIDVYSNGMERYNLEDGNWDYVTKMGEERGDVFYGSISEGSEGDKIYVMGGLRDNDYTISSKNEQYDTFDNVWTDKSDMPIPRFGGMSITINQDIYTIGGIKFNTKQNEIEVSTDLEVYHSEYDSWETLSSLPILNPNTMDEIKCGVAFGRAEHVIIVEGSILKNYIYILSGINSIYFGNDDVRIDNLNNYILRYCIEDDEWNYSEVIYNLDVYKRISPLSLVYDEKIYVFNGSFLDDNNDFIYPIESYYIDIN
jgi:N-acetylneuraminic acid mutarotase